jgi:hypothetical protein
LLFNGNIKCNWNANIIDKWKCQIDWFSGVLMTCIKGFVIRESNQFMESS